MHGCCYSGVDERGLRGVVRGKGGLYLEVRARGGIDGRLMDVGCVSPR